MLTESEVGYTRRPSGTKDMYTACCMPQRILSTTSARCARRRLSMRCVAGGGPRRATREPHHQPEGAADQIRRLFNVPQTVTITLRLSRYCSGHLKLSVRAASANFS
eukprot:5580785-Pleurochrysis_carterae.AAC.1